MDGKKKKKKQLPFRLNVLFILVFLLFTALILRLGIVQIVNGTMYQKQVDATVNVVTESNTPRGKMFDRNGTLIVDNDPVFNIVYTRSSKVSQEERLDIARKLANYIDKSTDQVMLRDKKDFYILTRGREALTAEKLTDAEKEQLNDEEEYYVLLDRITDKELETLTSQELEVLAIKREMDQGYDLSKQVIKEDVTQEEFARVNEHLSELEGVDVEAAAKRVFPFQERLKALIGETKQIPREKQNYYTAREYNRSDIVGTSGLEKQYEPLLHGVKEKTQFVTDKAGEPIGVPEVMPGESGKDLVLTIDMAFQQQVETIIEEELLKARQLPGNEDVNEAYVVSMDPKTGDMLSIAGKKYKNDTFQDALYGNYLNAFQVGSSIKGATVLTGYKHDVLSIGETIYDRPLRFNGKVKGSWKNFGDINDIQALAQSSNVYMFYVAMRLAGYDYDLGYFTKDRQISEALTKMRQTFYQFGLGVPTEVDLPYEATGYKGQAAELGHVMDFSIGQFDTYTPLQLLQYVSTIANDGYRVQPHFVKEMREPTTTGEPGQLMQTVEPVVLNRVNVEQKYIDRVQEGMRAVMTTGTASSYFEGLQAAGKTGTAEVDKEKGLDNKILVGYYPYDDPKMAFAIVVPNVKEGAINDVIGRRIVQTYSNMVQQTSPVSE